MVDNKAMQFESKIITGNGRRQTSRESTYLRDLSTFAKLRHLNEGSNSRASFGGNFVAGRKNSMCVCDVCMMCVMCACSVCVCVYDVCVQMCTCGVCVCDV